MRTLSVVLIFSILLLSFLSLSNSHIPPSEEDTSRQVVKQFYALLLSPQKITIKEFSEIYSNASEGGEASLLLRKDGSSSFDINNYMQTKKELKTKKESLESLTLNAIREHTYHLTFGLGLDSICQLINTATVYEEGWQFGMYLEITFPNTQSILFELNSDTPKKIEYIWLPNGESLGDIVQGNKVEKLKRPGTVNERIESIDVMEKPDSSSAVVGLIMKGEVFYYTPVGGEERWPVYPKEGHNQQGYIHRSWIVKYKDFPPELKEEVKKQRGGC